MPKEAALSRVSTYCLHRAAFGRSRLKYTRPSVARHHERDRYFHQAEPATPALYHRMMVIFELITSFRPPTTRIAAIMLDIAKMSRPRFRAMTGRRASMRCALAEATLRLEENRFISFTSTVWFGAGFRRKLMLLTTPMLSSNACHRSAATHFHATCCRILPLRSMIAAHEIFMTRILAHANIAWAGGACVFLVVEDFARTLRWHCCTKVTFF